MELLTTTEHGVKVFYDENEPMLGIEFPHEACRQCHADIVGLRRWLDSRGLLKENMN
ncbi:MAG TPA: hypothetical protein VMS84_07975 [Mycobacterium sp.]|jgi:hypothetical protein|nr:hypothetical protein [Mycobacterium sp.]